MAAKVNPVKPKNSDFISQDRNWKARVEQERFCAKNWDSKWKFSAGGDMKDEGKSGTGEAAQARPALIAGRAQTSSQEIGRLAADPACNLEVFGRLQCKPHGCLLTTLRWPKEAIQ